MVNKSQIAVFCLIVALLPFPSGCDITYGFPSVAAAHPSDLHDAYSYDDKSFFVFGLVANILFAVALFFVILRLSKHGLFKPPLLWGVWVVLFFHALILLTLISYYGTALLGILPGEIFGILSTALAFTIYLPVEFLDSLPGNDDFYYRASYVVMMGVFFCLGVFARRLWDRLHKSKDEFDK